MFRKITFVFLILVLAISAFGQQRKRTVGSGGISDAALAPMMVPGATISGKVTAVAGSIITVGTVKIDAKNAKIIDERGTAGTLASIVPGTTTIFAIISATTPVDALPASTIAIRHDADIELTGPAGPVDVAGGKLTVLGQAVTVNSNTSFGGRAHSLSDILQGDVVAVEASVVNGVLVATSVMVMSPPMMPSTVIHGTVKSIGPDQWVITDSAGKEWTILVDSQTKIIGPPKVGDAVEILANRNNANQYVAVAITKSPVVFPMVVFSGEVISIGKDAWVIHDSRSNQNITVAVNVKTIITGSPQVNDGVMVSATVDNGAYTAVTIFKLGIVPSNMTITGVVKSIEPNRVMAPCPAPGCDLAIWTVGPAVGMGPDMRIRVNGQTKVYPSPQVGDHVKVVAQMTSNGILAIEITKQ